MSTLMYKSGSSWIDVIHPVGSMWLSNSSTSPSSLFGGTWQQLTNAVLRAAAGYGYGGSDSHTLTIDEMPSHSHSDYIGYDVVSGNNAIGFRPYGQCFWSNSYTSKVGGGKRFQSFPVIAISIVGSELANGRKGVL